MWSQIEKKGQAYSLTFQLARACHSKYLPSLEFGLDINYERLQMLDYQQLPEGLLWYALGIYPIDCVALAKNEFRLYSVQLIVYIN